MQLLTLKKSSEYKPKRFDEEPVQITRLNLVTVDFYDASGHTRT